MDEEIPSCSTGLPSLTFIKRNGGTVLLRTGHQYILKEKYKNGMAAWECINRRKQKCGGKVTLKVSIIVILLLTLPQWACELNGLLEFYTY